MEISYVLHCHHEENGFTALEKTEFSIASQSYQVECLKLHPESSITRIPKILFRKTRTNTEYPRKGCDRNRSSSTLESYRNILRRWSSQTLEGIILMKNIFYCLYSFITCLCVNFSRFSLAKNYFCSK